MQKYPWPRASRLQLPYRRLVEPGDGKMPDAQLPGLTVVLISDTASQFTGHSARADAGDK